MLRLTLLLCAARATGALSPPTNATRRGRLFEQVGDMRVLRDVCLEPVRCNAKGFDPVHFRRRGPGDARASYRRGLTAMLLARHVETFDWTNYAHWMELCLRFYLAASLRRDALARARGLAGLSARALATIVLPQVDARARDCGRARVPALWARGAYSEVCSEV